MKRSLWSVFCSLALLLLSQSLYAQVTPISSKPMVVKTSDSGYQILNETDAAGRRQGLWYIQRKASKGINAYIAFGRYSNNDKEGMWYRLDKLGRLESIKNYTNGVLNGTSQYYKHGRLVCIGHFRGLNPKYEQDSFWVTNPITGVDTLVIIPSSRGTVRHGLWRYYSPISGQLVKEEMYQVGNLLYTKDFQVKPTAVDSFYYEQMPKHPPIDIKRASHRVPNYAKRKIGY